MGGPPRRGRARGQAASRRTPLRCRRRRRPYCLHRRLCLHALTRLHALAGRPRAAAARRAARARGVARPQPPPGRPRGRARRRPRARFERSSVGERPWRTSPQRTSGSTNGSAHRTWHPLVALRRAHRRAWDSGWVGPIIYPARGLPARRLPVGLPCAARPQGTARHQNESQTRLAFVLMVGGPGFGPGSPRRARARAARV